MIRRARFRGTWYPYDKESLDEIIGPLNTNGEYRIAVLPHSGLVFSGALIRSFFERIPKGISHVIILSPSHYYPIPASRIAVSEFTESETPYGNIKTNKLDVAGSFVNDDVVAAEHGIEMFLPFIGKLGFSVSYGVISALRKPEDPKIIAENLLPLIDDNTLLIASSDFTHYGSRFGYAPYPSNAKAMTVQHDKKCAALLATGDGCRAYREYSHSTICGIAPASIVAEIAELLGMEGESGDGYTSSDIYPDGDDDFVSYRTVFWRKNE